MNDVALWNFILRIQKWMENEDWRKRDKINKFFDVAVSGCSKNKIKRDVLKNLILYWRMLVGIFNIFWVISYFFTIVGLLSQKNEYLNFEIKIYLFHLFIHFFHSMLSQYSPAYYSRRKKIKLFVCVMLVRLCISIKCVSK